MAVVLESTASSILIAVLSRVKSQLMVSIIIGCFNRTEYSWHCCV